MLYEIHMLKSYPPTNLNRDDTGAPKTCVFGGTTRGRISSQCLKRSWRMSKILQDEIGKAALGTRTRYLPDMVAKALTDMGVDPDYIKAVKTKITGIANKKGEENSKGCFTTQTLFYSPEDIQAVAETVKAKLAECETLQAVKELKAKDVQTAVKGAKTRPITLDIALFGRMATSNAFRDVEASMQVAHAISTHKVCMEADYFTAMDDLLSGETMEEMGASMIDDIDYNASCYYLYASIDTDKLRENLKYTDDADEIAKKTLPALLRTMAFSNPSGKQNSFAGHVLPSAIMIDCKDTRIQTNMVNAYVTPASGKDIVAESIKKLAKEVDIIDHDFSVPIKERLWFCSSKYADIAPQSATKVCDTFSTLIQAAEDTMM